MMASKKIRVTAKNSHPLSLTLVVVVLTARAEGASAWWHATLAGKKPQQRHHRHKEAYEYVNV